MPQRALELSAPAKINLYLGVHTQTDARGYHRVDTVMARLGLADRVRIEPARELSVAMSPAIDLAPERNSVWRAARLLGEAVGRDPAVAIRIEKHIPLCAGLGGPSTDAAAVLRGLCELWDIDPLDGRVVEVARAIGADVPFFLGEGLAYLAGAGDVLAETFELSCAPAVVLVKPHGCGVSAPEAYRRFDECPCAAMPLEPMLAALRARDTAGAIASVSNNLAPSACRIAPQISEVLAWLREQAGVLVAEVSGSGSSSFAICTSAEAAAAVAEAADQRGWWSCATQMEKSGSIPIAG